MANELTINQSLKYDDGTTQISVELAGGLSSPAALTPVESIQTATTSAAAVNLGGLASLGCCQWINLDATNYVDLYTGDPGGSGKHWARLQPGGSIGASLYHGADVQTPWMKAHTASCKLKILLNPQ